MLENILFFTNCQKVLAFFARNPEKEFFDREISKLTGISRAGANFALRDLAKTGLILRQRRGRMFFYKASLEQAVIKYIKVLQNITLLFSLIEKLKKVSLSVVLYGSAAKGENMADSDIDVFIMTRNPQEVKDIIFKDKLRQKLQGSIYSPNDFIKFKKHNLVFCREIEKGIVLWRQK